MTKYPRFEAFVASHPEVQLDENQKAIIHERSLLLSNGDKETWKAVAKRVALAAAKDTSNYAADTRTVEDDAIDFFNTIYTLRMIPATPVLLNAGTSHQQLFSCFATVVKDDMKEQFDLKYTAAQIFELSAGIGYNFSFVRPKDSIVGRNGALAYGVIALMYAMHVNCEMIKTGSVGRRGAQLAALDVYHPEIFKFVSCKQNEKHFKSFNISVIIDKNFLDAVREDKMITCRTWKNERPPKYSARRLWNKLVSGGWLNGEPGILFMDNANEGSCISHYGKIESTNPCLHGDTLISTAAGEIPIKNLAEYHSFFLKNAEFKDVVSKAWYTGDKQCIKLTLEDGTNLICTPDHKITTLLGETDHSFFTNTNVEDVEAWRTLGKKVLTQSSFKAVTHIENIGVHPVYDFSEPIDHHGWANGIHVHNCGEIPTVDYGSCNLGSINLLQCLNEEGNDLDYSIFEDAIRKSTRFLDNLIAVNEFPDKKFKKVEEYLRSIGISVMGFADLLIKMKIPYDSEAGQIVADKISDFRKQIALDESEKIAAIRGVAPVFLAENGAPENAPKRRNAFITTQAPTGSVSMIANCSPSMEPIFGLTMTKKCLDGKTFKYINPDFEAFLKTKHIPESHMKLITEHVYTYGSLKGLPEMTNDDMVVEYWSPEEVRHFITAHDINYRDRLKMQAIFQKHTDQAISSTVNLPESATKEDVADMIMLAHELGLKGICCYRSGSRKNQVLNIGDPNKNTWLCLHCGKVNVEEDPNLDPTKVCIKCQHCGAASCAQK